MGLSYNSNWPATIQLQNPDMVNSFVPELAPHELFTFHDNFFIPDTCVDPLFFDPPPPLYDDQSLFINHPANLLLPLPEFFPQQPYFLLDSSSDNFGQQPQLYCCPKRQKTAHEDYLGDIFDNGTSNFLNPTMDPLETILLSELPPEMLLPPLLDHSEVQTTWEAENPPLTNLPEVYSHVVHHADTTTSTSTTSNSCVDVSAKTKAIGGSLSPQSIAARLRRKKISEKTGELGKLIPGGHKMNTAEMFQAASKYIKFLQAQIGILQTMPSLQENEGGFDGEEFGALVTSPLVQEKMYMAEKCLVPKKLIEMSLANDHHQLQSKPQLLKDISQFITKIDP